MGTPFAKLLEMAGGVRGGRKIKRLFQVVHRCQFFQGHIMMDVIWIMIQSKKPVPALEQVRLLSWMKQPVWLKALSCMS